MSLKPCVVCGDISDRSRCPEHRARDTRTNRTHVAWKNNAHWKNLSKRLRRLSPFCETCGAIEDLTTDHILPVDAHPELVYSEENCRILCRPCNGKRGNAYTHEEAQDVLQRLQAAYDRKPTRKAMERLDVAQRAVQAGGGGAGAPTDRPAGKAQRALHT